MNERPVAVEDAVLDIGDYCRRIEAHLTRVNDGQIIRIVGPAFELARAWAREGIPLSVVCHGIDCKAERHRTGRSRRALRLEFCEADVVSVYDQWQRAVGLRRGVVDAPEASETSSPQDSEPKPAAIGRHLERAIDRLSRVTGRLDLSDAFRAEVGRALQAVSDLREAVRVTRGAARIALLERLPALDTALVQAARAEVGADGLRPLEQQAAEELAAFRNRLAPAAWDQSIALSVARLLRDQLGLPTLSDS